ncbi:MAG: CbbQ/NirQ/NorQ/GpvN family protein [Nitrospirae bacterium]|nr:CbbQ/NirQ/NorQ/GpvN family protein [Nitrospirota bacterium]
MIEPYYLPSGEEVRLFKIAFETKIPVTLKGPTGCGKTRFVEYMSHQLKVPLITVSCHEDLTASDLVGRYLLKGNETVWTDGPLTTAVKEGGICYLDEVVEARKDTTVVIHPLSDSRRILPIEKKGTVLQAHPNFMLVLSYNPGYQSLLKELKQSTKQRFLALEFSYPPIEQETEIVRHEADLKEEMAEKLVKIGQKIRNLKNQGLDEGVSTRLLIYAGKLIKNGIAPLLACQIALSQPLTDDPEMQKSIREIVSSIL